MSLHALHLFKWDGSQDLLHVIELGRTDSHAEFGIVENVGVRVMGALTHKDWNAACINGVLDAERPAWCNWDK
jgi:hypothetical protein